MAKVAQAFAGGFESGQAIGDTIVADRDLKQAQSESGPGADLFTTYQKAGQMAMQSGNTRVADKFLKQANEYKGDALKLKLDEMKVHHAEVSDFERTIRANDNPDSLKAAISSSDKLNPQEKLEYTGLVDKAQKSGKWDEFHKAIGQSTETYKEQQATQIAILKEQLAEQKVLFDMNYKSEKLRIDAGKSAGKPSPAEKRASAMEDWKTKRGIVQEEAIEGRRATALKELKTKTNIPLKYSPEGYGPSDQASFYAENIPVFFLTTGAHEDYHTPFDDAYKINYDGEKQVLDYTYLLSLKLINIPKALTFKEAGPKSNGGYGGTLKVTLGIMPDMASQDNNGLKADLVRKGGPAEKAGMLKGDIIVAVDGKPVKNIYEYMARLKQLQKGQLVSVDVMRNGQKVVLLVQL